MFYPIYTYGEEVLRKKAEDVDLNDPELPVLIEDMFTTMRMAHGAGLAAPQIGLNKRIIVVEEEISDGVIFKAVFLNANIIGYSGYITSMTEGCLSFPGIRVEVQRHTFIDVEWYDEDKKYHRELISGIKAIILQHEIDHLNGVLFIDKINSDDRLKIFMQLEHIKNKKVKTTYPIK
jgi:peptide deformylase